LDLNENSDVSKGENLTPEDLKNGFKILMHSFYNNPNAIVDTKTKTIKTNSNAINSDLNFISDIGSDKFNGVISSWIKLKNYVLNNLSQKQIRSNDFEEFFKEAFKGDVDSSELISIEPILTATKYNKNINTPFAKHGFKEDKTLGNGKTFITLSAKLILGQKVHYITLAAFGTEEQILKKATEYNVDNVKIEEKFREIEKLLEASQNNFLELPIDDIENIKIITSTRLEKVFTNSNKRVTYDLSSLEENFPGMNISEIRFFPRSLEEFKKLLKKYTFGPERFSNQGLSDSEIEKKIKVLFEGNRDKNGKLIKDADGKTNSGLKNKPYIVVSTKEDLDGNENVNTTQAVLIPIGSNQRNLDTLTKEVEDLLEERRLDMENGYTNNKKISPEINAKTEILLNRSDILSVLIKWGKTKYDNGTLLDLLTKEIEFSLSDTVTGNKTSVFDIFSRFKNSNAETSVASRENMKKVIDFVKEALAKNENATVAEIKESVVSKMDKMTGWH